MPEFGIEEAAAILHARIVGDSSSMLTSAALDSRDVRAGTLFVALRGEKVDGHDYAAAAFAAGAGAALVSHEIPVAEHHALLVVRDVAEALLALARALRDREKWTVVAVTGSAGKTTTKEMTAVVLAGAKRTAASPGNRNSTLGLPEAMISAPGGLEVFVAECGMSYPGELSKLADAVRPDVVVYTNIAAVHLQNFGSIDDIEMAKEELIASAGAGATVVSNADDPRATAIARRHPGPRLLYGIESTDAEIGAESIEPMEAATRFVLRTPSGRSRVELPLPGRHNVSNFLAAAAAGTALGLGVEDIAARAPFVRPAAHRGERHVLASGAIVVDESYNSNPQALIAAAETFGSIRTGGRRIGILGEMRELGASSEQLHRDAGRRIAPFFDEIVAVGGGDARALIEGAREGGISPRSTKLLPTPESAAAAVAERLAPGDRILLKGSRGVELERALPVLGVPVDASHGRTERKH